jgi:hypothetical protein
MRTMENMTHTHIIAFASGKDTAVDIAAGHVLSYEHSHGNELVSDVEGITPHHHIEFVPNGINMVKPENPYLPKGEH